MSVTRFGVSVEKVVATMETPRSHQGMLRPAAKNSTELDPAFRVTARPMASDTAKKSRMFAQSMG